MIEKIIEDVLSQFLLLGDDEFERYLKTGIHIIKERIATLNDLQVIIYSNDHNPPHFHVKSNDLRVDAKFTIDKCELIGGSVSAKEMKRIKAFHASPKGEVLMKLIWSKKSI